MKGLSEGVTGYAGSKGWKVIVQDPSLDPQKQVTQVHAGPRVRRRRRPLDHRDRSGVDV